ncbi:MAG: Trk family potassium uptake protein, partial [Clostridia bacterium]|nr:Trk family potassium uptake protein [Clostridia bacterium]
KGKKRTEVFGRTIPTKSIFDAMTLFFLVLSAAICGAMVISMVEGVDFMAAFYETMSAIATVGLSLGLTPGLGSISRLLLILLMFLGRVGIITVGMAALMRGNDEADIKLPEGKVIIG